MNPSTFGGQAVPSDATFVAFDCERCGMSLTLPPGMCVVDHPAVVFMYHEHGADVRERPLVTLEFLNVRVPVVESEQPVRVRIDVPVGDDRLSVWLDADADVDEYERE